MPTEKTCHFCSKTFHKYSKPATYYFCSRACYHSWKSIKENNPNFKGGDISFTCQQCKKAFTVSRDRISSQEGKFCSIVCSIQRQQQNVMSTKQVILGKMALKQLTYWIRNNTYPHLKSFVKKFDFTPEEFKTHIENQMESWMCWSTYGTTWAIDHIVPQSSFCYESYNDEEFKKCFALSNLRPLCSAENNKKHKRISI